MVFNNISNTKTALSIAVDSDSAEMVKLLLTHPKIDVNIKSTVLTISFKSSFFFYFSWNFLFL